MLPTFVSKEDVPLGPTFLSSDMRPTPRINSCLVARIGWCHRQAMSSSTSAEAKKWWAETQGLIDALLHRDSTFEYESMPGLRERYASGLKDGDLMIQTARMISSCHHRYGSIAPPRETSPGRS
jgi:hypothetical protein